MLTRRPTALALALLLLALTTLLPGWPARAQPASVHLAMGNPSGAVADPSQPANYLIARDQCALAYSRDRGIPTWVSWHLQAADLGPTPRAPPNQGPFRSVGTAMAGPPTILHTLTSAVLHIKGFFGPGYFITVKSLIVDGAKRNTHAFLPGPPKDTATL